MTAGGAEERFALERGGWISFERRFLPPAEADSLFAVLRDELAWRQEYIRIAGRRIAQPRLTTWYGDAGARYSYSGLALEPRPWHPALDGVRRRTAGHTGHALDSVLCNLYRDGSDSMGWHADAERELGPDPVIVSLSLGAARRFLVRRRGRPPGRPLELALDHGSLLVMGGTTQHHYQHSVPKQRAPVGPRINLTFRRIVHRDEGGADREAAQSSSRSSSAPRARSFASTFS